MFFSSPQRFVLNVDESVVIIWHRKLESRHGSLNSYQVTAQKLELLRLTQCTNIDICKDMLLIGPMDGCCTFALLTSCRTCYRCISLKTNHLFSVLSQYTSW